MVWCSNCGRDIDRTDYSGHKKCCSLCGKVLYEDNFSQEPTFVKNAGGQSQLAGSFVNTIQDEYPASRKRILDEAHHGIDSMIYALGIGGGDSIASAALAFYTIALEKKFTRGRRKEQVEAACLYIVCRAYQEESEGEAALNLQQIEEELFNHICWAPRIWRLGAFSLI